MCMPSSSLARDASLLAIGAGCGMGVVYYLACRYSRHVERAYDEYKREAEEHRTCVSCTSCLDSSSLEHDDVVAEQLTRNVQFFGLEGQKKVADSFVVVVGLGGVGSHCAHMLLRSGVGRLRLVDFDQISLSSLNRHCVAVREDVGTPKSACLEKYFRRILPEASVEAMNIMYRREVEEDVLGGSPDFVVDAIDNIDTKIELLAACKARGLPVLAVAGAGAKADPTRLRFVDIAESCSDPLARSVRTRLRKLHGISSGIPVLMSTERPRCGLVDSGESAEELLQYQVVPNFRIRTIPVLGTTPSAFGMAAAGYVLCELAGQGIDPYPILRRSEKSMETQYHRLENRLGKEPEVDLAEVEVLVREIWRGESARATEVSPLKGLTKSIGNLHLTVWNPALGATVDNLVLLTSDEADAHDRLVAQPGGLRALQRDEPEYVAKVERRLQRARRDFKYGYYDL